MRDSCHASLNILCQLERRLEERISQASYVIIIKDVSIKFIHRDGKTISRDGFSMRESGFRPPRWL